MSKSVLEHCSPRQAAESAIKWNAALAMGEATAAALTGNIGFIGEAFHNSADTISFFAKRRAMDAEKARSLRLRKVAAWVLASGSLAAFGGAAYHAVESKNEDASDAAIAVAIVAAAANSRVAFKAHSANHEDSDEAVGHAHDDSKLHAITDAATGWIYAGSLAAERFVPGTADYAIMLNGAIATSAAGMMLGRIRQQKNTED